jgi:hypothetical protein
VQRKLSEALSQQLIHEVIRDSVDAHVQVTEEELRQTYESEELGWQILPAHILSATEAEAAQVAQALTDGADFATLARDRSLAEDAGRGGNLERFFHPADIAAPVSQVAFELAEGQVSDPIQTSEGYEIVKVLARRRLPFVEMRDGLVSQLRKRRRAARMAEFVDRLKERWQVHYHGEQADAVLRGLRRGGLPPSERAALLVEYRGGSVNVGELIDALAGLKSSHRPADSLGVFLAVDRSALRDSLVLLQARRDGRNDAAQLLAWGESKREELVFEQLYREEVASRVSVSEAEVRRHYEERIDAYTSLPGAIEMTEVLVDTDEEARRILAAAQEGESLRALAHRHSRRGQVGPVGGHTFGDSGRVWIEPLFQSPYRDALGDANTQDVGKVLGPIRVQRSYSVFRLDAPIELTAVPYDQVRRPIRHRLQKARESVRFDAFLDSLRVRHAPVIRWFEDHLARAGVAELVAPVDAQTVDQAQ